MKTLIAQLGPTCMDLDAPVAVLQIPNGLRRGARKLPESYE